MNTDFDGCAPSAGSASPALKTSISLKTQSQANRRRKARRSLSKQLHGHPPTRETLERIVHEAEIQHVDFATQETAHIRGAFTGVCERFATEALKKAHQEEIRRPRSVEELLSQGFQYIGWEGRSIYIVDCNNIVFAVIAAPPSQSDYSLSAERAFQQIMLLSQRLPVPAVHRRGAYPVLNLGIHHGIGLKQPVNLKLNKRDRGIAEELL